MHVRTCTYKYKYISVERIGERVYKFDLGEYLNAINKSVRVKRIILLFHTGIPVIRFTVKFERSRRRRRRFFFLHMSCITPLHVHLNYESIMSANVHSYVSSRHVSTTSAARIGQWPQNVVQVITDTTGTC